MPTQAREEVIAVFQVLDVEGQNNMDQIGNDNLCLIKTKELVMNTSRLFLDSVQRLTYFGLILFYNLTLTVPSQEKQVNN